MPLPKAREATKTLESTPAAIGGRCPPYNYLIFIFEHLLSLSIGNGRDWSESAYSALMNTIQGKDIGGWREDAEKVIILFTDSPPHDPEPFTGYTLDSIVNASKNLITIQNNSSSNFLASSSNFTSNKKLISIYSVFLGDDDEALDYFTKLSNQTRGKIYQSDEIISTFYNVISDIKEDITTRNLNSKSIPEPSPKLGLLMLCLAGIFYKFIPFRK